MELILANIDAHRGNARIGFVGHGCAPLIASPSQHHASEGQEHGRTIPLAALRPRTIGCETTEATSALHLQLLFLVFHFYDKKAQRCVAGAENEQAFVERQLNKFVPQLSGFFFGFLIAHDFDADHQPFTAHFPHDFVLLWPIGGATQDEFSDHLGTRQQTISEWEVGKHRPRGASRVLLSVIAESAGFSYSADGAASDEGEPPRESH